MYSVMSPEIQLSIDEREIDVQKLFVQHPEMSRYFYKRQPLPDKHPNDSLERARVYAFCEIILRQFDFIARYAHRSNSMPEEIWVPYLNRMKYVYANSPVLRHYLESHSEHYSKYLQEMLESV